MEIVQLDEVEILGLAVIHMAAAGAQRESVLKQIEASDSFAFMQAKIIRETVFKTAAALAGASDADKRAWTEETTRLRSPTALWASRSPA